MFTYGKNLALLVIAGSLVASCGGKKKNNKENPPQVPGASENVVEDAPPPPSQVPETETQEQEETSLASDHIDEAADALSDVDSGSSGAALSLAGALVVSKDTRSCSADPSGSIILKRDFSALLEGFKTRWLSLATIKVTYDLMQTLTWKKEGSLLECNPAGVGAKLDWNDPNLISGLKGEYQFSRNRTQVIEKEQLLLSKNFEASGIRNVSFVSQVNLPESGLVVRSKEIVMDASRVGQRTLKLGSREKNFAFDHKILTLEGHPLKVQVTRDATTGAWTQKLIESGKVQTEKVGIRKVISEFNQVLFKKGEESCTPVSGKILSTIFNPDGSFLHRYEIVFKEGAESNSATISKCVSESDDSSCSLPVEYTEGNIRGCSLEAQ